MKADSMTLFGAWLIDMLQTFGLAACQGDKKADISKNDGPRRLDHMITEQPHLRPYTTVLTIQHSHVLSRAESI